MFKRPATRAVIAVVWLSAPTAAAGQTPPPAPTPTPGRLDLPRRPAQLRIYGANRPGDLTARGGTPLDFTTMVAVRNDGQQTGHFSVAAQVEGSTARPRSDTWSVAPGMSRRVPLRIQAVTPEFAAARTELAITLLLLSADGVALHQYDLRVPYARGPNPLFRTSPTPSVLLAARGARRTVRPNLEIVTGSVPAWMERGTRDAGSRGGRQVRQIGFVNFVMTGRVRNTTNTGLWGYPARVQFDVLLGTPETGTSALTGEISAGSVDVPGNLAPGATRDVTFVLPWASHLRPGLWHTLAISIMSATDTDNADNGFHIVFMYDAEGRLVSQHHMLAPGSPVRAVRR
jgi:hypothetical protein